jgi:hypothetical protein
MRWCGKLLPMSVLMVCPGVASGVRRQEEKKALRGFLLFVSKSKKRFFEFS